MNNTRQTIFDCLQQMPAKRIDDETGIEYITLDMIPDLLKEPFNKWMRGQTGVIIDGELCTYWHDWERWWKLYAYNTPTYFD